MSRGDYLGNSLISAKHKLNNLIALIDYNKIQALSKIKDALPLETLIKNFSLLIGIQ